MTGRLRTSKAGLDLIASFEGFRETSMRLPDGRWTVGYGHVRTAREGVKITESDALDLLTYDLKPIESGIQSLVFAPLNQNQFDALVSLGFNISMGQLKDSSILHALNEGDEIAAATAFDAWRKARINGRLIIVDALIRRRAAEKALFLEPVGGRAVAPTPIVTPVLDTGAPAPVVSRLQAPTAYQVVEDNEPADDEPTASTVAPDIARAVELLASQQKPSTLRKPILSGIGVHEKTDAGSSPSAHEQASPAPAAEVASQVAADRLSKILARVDPPRAKAHPQSSPSARQSGNGHSAPTAQRSIPEDMPNFDVLGDQPRGGRRVVIDDTEVIRPSRSPEALFAAALEEERLVNSRVNRKVEGGSRLRRLGPWIAIAALCATGLGVAVSEALSQATGSSNAGSLFTTLVAVFGLLLVMSVYYLATRYNNDD